MVNCEDIRDALIGIDKLIAFQNKLISQKYTDVQNVEAEFKLMEDAQSTGYIAYIFIARLHNEISIIKRFLNAQLIQCDRSMNQEMR